MKNFLLIAALLLSAGPVLADPAVGLDAIEDLGRLNGRALACGQMAVSGQVKALMIKHAPKTRRYGEVFEEATNAAYLAQGGEQGNCPSPAEFASQRDQVATRLQTALPAVQ